MGLVWCGPVRRLIPWITSLLSRFMMVDSTFLTEDLIAVGALPVPCIDICGYGSLLAPHAPGYGYVYNVLLFRRTGFWKSQLEI